MMFLQGTRDALADLSLLAPWWKNLDAIATLKLFNGADHSFHMAPRIGRSDGEVRGEMLDELTAWIDHLLMR